MEPYYQDEAVTLYCGDCRDVLPTLGLVDLAIADPPYGVTSLAWDRHVDGWAELLPCVSLWCFGSLRFFLEHAPAGWKYAQDIVWEKHNGSGFAADRFRRVHEHAVHFYRGEWAGIYKAAVYTHDATARRVRRSNRPRHMGAIGPASYESHDGGPRIMRSVVYERSCHGHADHPTQKPVGIVAPLVEHSCPPGGVVLDPFAGSGTTLVAAKRLGRKAIGIELNPAYCDVIVSRLRQGSLLGGVA